MQIRRLDISDSNAIEQYISLRRSIFAEKWWDRFTPNWEVERRQLLYPQPAEVHITELGWQDGAVVGGLELSLTTKENLHHANGKIFVHPEYVRSETRASLLDRLIELTAEHDRTQVSVMVHKPLEGHDPADEVEEEFFRSRGFELALELVDQEAAIDFLEKSAEETIYTEARAAAAGYEIASWIGAVPEEYLQALVELDRMTMSQVPLGKLELEDEDMDTERRRAFDVSLEKVGLTLCQTVARHQASGQVVANTVVAVQPPPSDFGSQWITIVAPGHRGHRLGTLVKLANLRQLRVKAPHVRRLHTENALVNQHMNAINRQIGFVPFQTGREYLLRPANQA